MNKVTIFFKWLCGTMCADRFFNRDLKARLQAAGLGD